MTLTFLILTLPLPYNAQTYISTFDIAVKFPRLSQRREDIYILVRNLIGFTFHFPLKAPVNA